MQQPFRVGEHFLVEPPLNRVTGPRGVNRLEPKVMVVLVCLAEHAGEMVPKNRLLQAAWPDTAVSDDVLTRAISELRRLFEDDSKQPHTIETIAKGGYRLIAPVGVVAPQVGPLWSAAGELVPDSVPAATAAASAGQSLPQPSRRAAFGAVGAAAVVLLALAGAWQLRGRPTTPVPAMRVVPLTAMSGSEDSPAFSPDGRQIAFAWNGEGQDNFDIYVKLVGSSEVRRLTTGPGIDVAPAWSPDGRQVAYVRFDPPYRSHVRVMSSLGGSDRMVSDFAVWPPAIWSPDGRYLVAGRAAPPDAAYPTNGIHLIPVRGGEPRAITRPRTPGTDKSPAFSPDGRRLAYASCDKERWFCRVDVVDLDSDLAAIGPSRQLTGALWMRQSSLTWSVDGRFVIFNAADLAGNYLWRVGVDGNRPPERIEMAGVNAFFPFTAPAGDRLVFARILHDEDVYRFEPPQSAQPVARSPVFDSLAQFSPDGRRIAFCSRRSGDAIEVWVANADGSRPEQLTHGPGRLQGGPSWSPDGRRVAFESVGPDGYSHVWSVDTEGGTPQQITDDPGDQRDPTWSRNGEWVYFSWALGNNRDIWRTRGRFGPNERVTRGGGFIGRESADGTTLYYIPEFADSPLLAQPLTGGPPRPVIACVASTAFAVSQAGVHYVPCTGLPPDPDPPVHVLDPATGKDTEVGRLEKFQYKRLPSGFAVSADGRTILYGRLVRDEADLMLIENFK